MKVMRAKRIPLPQGATADVLRDKLKEVDERLYEANIECTSSCERAAAQKSTSRVVSRRCKRTVRGDVPFKWRPSTTYNGLKEHVKDSNTQPGCKYR